MLPEIAQPSATSRSSVGFLKKYVFSDPQLALFDQCLVSGYRFLAAWMIGRLAGADALGDYTIAMGAIILAGVLQESLIIRPFQTFVYHKEEDSSRRFNASVLVQMFLMAMLIGTGLVAAGTTLGAFELIKPSTARLLLILAFCVPGTLVGEFTRRFSLARIKFTHAIAIDSAIILMMVAGFLILRSTSNFNVLAVLIVLGSVNFTVGIAAVLALRRQFVVRWDEIGRDILENLRFGWWFCLSQALSVMHGYLVPWLVYYSIGASAAGQLGACYNLTSLSHPMILGFSSWLGPQATKVFAQQGSEALSRLILQSASCMGLMVIAYWLVLVVFGEELMVFVFGPEFSGLGTVVILIGALPFGQVFSSCGANGLAALRKPRSVLFGTVAGILSTLTTYFWFTSSWQLVGATAALSLGALVAGWTLFGLVFFNLRLIAAERTAAQ